MAQNGVLRVTAWCECSSTRSPSKARRGLQQCDKSDTLVFDKWQVVKHGERLSDDNAVAQYLLKCRKQLRKRLLTHNVSITYG